MIKVIAFDMVGVLIGEKNIEITENESKIERLFGDNLSDACFIKDVAYLTNLNDDKIEQITCDIIKKLYYVKDVNILKNIKQINKNILTIIATNHVSYIDDYIKNNFDQNYLDDVIISAKIGMTKPDKDFFEYILNKYNIEPCELLFLDDSTRNVESANKMGINVIQVTRNTNLFLEIKKYI